MQDDKPVKIVDGEESPLNLTITTLPVSVTMAKDR